MNVREYQESDLEEISCLYYNTIHLVNAKDYNQSQIQAWAPRIYDNSFWEERFQKYCVFVAEANNRVVGFAEFESTGHIDCFYVHHDWQRQGIGTRLMQRIEAEAQHKPILQLFADVSITAKPFFEQHGFTVVREQMVQYRVQHFKQYYMVKPMKND